MSEGHEISLIIRSTSLKCAEMAERNRDIDTNLLHSSSIEYHTASTGCELWSSTCILYEETLPQSSNDCIRPCYYLLQLLGMWRPAVQDDRIRVKVIMHKIYDFLIHLLWLVSLVAVMALDFIHYGFRKKQVHFADILNSVPTCLNLLCPFVFTQIYFKRGQFAQLVLSVQNMSAEQRETLRKRAKVYTWISVTLWLLSAVFFTFHWKPFFSSFWHYAVYIIVIVYTTGWWAVWLSIYAFVCHVHSLQIDALVDSIRSKETRPVQVLYRQQQLRNSLDRTQKDFNFIISFAISYHALDIIIFSFAYFDDAFGKRYELWQYAGGVTFDLVTILIKLFPPAVVAAAIHRTVTQAGKRCDVTPLMESLPQEDMQLFQYMVNCEQDIGLKILSIRITVELVGTILMTIVTAGVSFVAFVVPRLKYM